MLSKPYTSQSTPGAYKRTNATLLPSVLKKTFPHAKDLNIAAGYMLMGVRLASMLGNAMAGPLLSKTHKYKTVVVAAITGACTAYVVGIVGIKLSSLTVMCVGEVVFGLSVGFAVIGINELMVEITFPFHLAEVFATATLGTGFMWVVSTVVGRGLLDAFGAIASYTLSLALLTLSVIFLTLQKMPYYREQAEETAQQPLLQGKPKKLRKQRMEQVGLTHLVNSFCHVQR